MSDGSIKLYEARGLAAPGANTSFAAFAMGRPSAGVRIFIRLTTASVLNLYSTDGTTAYTAGLKDSEALSAGDEHVINVPALPVSKPGTGLGTAGVAAVAMAYALRVETDSIIEYVRVGELLTTEFGSAVREPPSAAAIAAAIVANPPAITVSDNPGLNPASVTIIPAAATVAQNRWSAAVAFALGGTYTGVIQSVELIGDKNTGAVLSDCYGDLAVFSSDPTLAAADTTLTAAQAKLLIGICQFVNAELVTDTNTFRFTGLTQLVFGSLSSLYVAFFSRGTTSFAAAQKLDVRLGITRLS